MIRRLLGRLPFVRLARCLSVSVGTTLLSLAVLTVLVTAGMRPWLANVVATAVGTVPSYVLNRRWVWGVAGRSDPWREVAPFWVLSFSGLALSTFAVDRADRLATAWHLTGATRTLGLLVANVGAFGALWVVQFVLLQHLFRRPPTPSVSHR